MNIQHGISGQSLKKARNFEQMISVDEREKGITMKYLCYWRLMGDKMRPAGFEPATYCLEGSCSIQMSYDLLNSQFSLQICYMYTIGVKKSQGLFSAAEIARLKNAASLLTQTSFIDVCAIAHEFNGLKN